VGLSCVYVCVRNVVEMKAQSMALTPPFPPLLTKLGEMENDSQTDPVFRRGHTTAQPTGKRLRGGAGPTAVTVAENQTQQMEKKIALRRRTRSSHA
jgi:hypothetical protein